MQNQSNVYTKGVNLEEEIFIPEKRAKFLRELHRHDGVNVCIENAENDDEIFLCKTLEINRLSDDIEYHTTVKQGSIHNEIKELERILKSMPILSSDD